MIGEYLPGVIPKLPPDHTAVPNKRYKELLQAEKKLRLLEAGGVENWEWYDASLEDYSDDDEEDEGEQNATRT
jgi:hypothetical protein